MIEFIFAPKEQFKWVKETEDSVQMIGLYLPGNTYNCTAKPLHDELREKCKEWEAEGKIEVYPLPPGKSFTVTEVG